MKFAAGNGLTCPSCSEETIFQQVLGTRRVPAGWRLQAGGPHDRAAWHRAKAAPGETRRNTPGPQPPPARERPPAKLGHRRSSALSITRRHGAGRNSRRGGVTGGGAGSVGEWAGFCEGWGQAGSTWTGRAWLQGHRGRAWSGVAGEVPSLGAWLNCGRGRSRGWVQVPTPQTEGAGPAAALACGGRWGHRGHLRPRVLQAPRLLS